MPPRDPGPQFVIYALSTDGVSHRYVGFTGKSGLKQRMAQHRFRSRHCTVGRTPQMDWMQEVGVENVVGTVLEKQPEGTSAHDLSLREMYWISQLRAEGYDLLNKSDGGLGPNGAEGPRFPLRPGDPLAKRFTGRKHSKPHVFRDIDGQVDSGKRGAHNRWHAGRGITKADCAYCEK